MRKIAPWALGLVASLAIGTAAYAVIIFDSGTGTGFVGKGDVQTACGWNNAQLQAMADGVSFAYAATDHYTAVCSFITGDGTPGETTHDVDHKTTTEVDSTVAYDARVHQQIDGFNLNGYGAVTETGEVPVVGEACPGNEGHDGTWSSVTLTSSTGGLQIVCP